MSNFHIHVLFFQFLYFLVILNGNDALSLYTRINGFTWILYYASDWSRIFAREILLVVVCFSTCYLEELYIIFTRNLISQVQANFRICIWFLLCNSPYRIFFYLVFYAILFPPYIQKDKVTLFNLTFHGYFFLFCLFVDMIPKYYSC